MFKYAYNKMLFLKTKDFVIDETKGRLIVSLMFKHKQYYIVFNRRHILQQIMPIYSSVHRPYNY